MTVMMVVVSKPLIMVKIMMTTMTAVLPINDNIEYNDNDDVVVDDLFCLVS